MLLLKTALGIGQCAFVVSSESLPVSTDRSVNDRLPDLLLGFGLQSIKDTAGTKCTCLQASFSSSNFRSDHSILLALLLLIDECLQVQESETEQRIVDEGFEDRQ